MGLITLNYLRLKLEILKIPYRRECLSACARGEGTTKPFSSTPPGEAGCGSSPSSWYCVAFRFAADIDVSARDLPEALSILTMDALSEPTLRKHVFRAKPTRSLADAIPSSWTAELSVAAQRTEPLAANLTRGDAPAVFRSRRWSQDPLPL